MVMVMFRVRVKVRVREITLLNAYCCYITLLNA